MGFLANCDTTIVPTRAAFAVSECRSSLPLTAPLLSPKIVFRVVTQRYARSVA